MDRETTKQMYGQVLQQIQAGDPMAAYSIFEQMPFPDQMAMFMTPGVGDAIAAVEAGVFNERSKENFAQGNVGSRFDGCWYRWSCYGFNYSICR